MDTNDEFDKIKTQLHFFGKEKDSRSTVIENETEEAVDRHNNEQGQGVMDAGFVDHEMVVNEVGNADMVGGLPSSPNDRFTVSDGARLASFHGSSLP